MVVGSRDEPCWRFLIWSCLKSVNDLSVLWGNLKICLFAHFRQHSELLVLFSWLQHAGSGKSRCSLHHSDQWYPLSPVVILLWDEDVSYVTCYTPSTTVHICITSLLPLVLSTSVKSSSISWFSFKWVVFVEAQQFKLLMLLLLVILCIVIPPGYTHTATEEHLIQIS